VLRELDFYVSSDAYKEDLGELSNLLPFRGEEEALWALRIEKENATLDLFGLTVYETKVKIAEGYAVTWDGADNYGGEVVGLETDKGHDVAVVRLIDGTMKRIPVDQLELHHRDAIIRQGDLAYVLRGQDLSLFDVVLRAKRWWASFSGQPIGSGRPRDSGTFSSADDFRRALRLATEKLRTRGDKVTQEGVAELLHCDISTLKRWVRRAGFSSWGEAKVS
jgi:hypothetical protein